MASANYPQSCSSVTGEGRKLKGNWITQAFVEKAVKMQVGL